MNPTATETHTTSEDTIDIDDVYAALSQHIKGFSPRKGQKKLSKTILAGMREGFHVLANAPTGFGKSFSALAPAIVEAANSGKRTIISTETINLQDQYINKDLPLLCAALGIDIAFAVAKGKTNYVCRLKLTEESNSSEVFRWAKGLNFENSRGDISEFKGHSDREDIKMISVDNECSRKACAFYGEGSMGISDCFHYDAVGNYRNANIVVTNHNLLLLDAGKGRILGDYDYLVVDEAHSFAEKATDSWGCELQSNTLTTMFKSVDKLLSKAGLTTLLTKDDYDELDAAQNALFDLIRAQSDPNKHRDTIDFSNLTSVKRDLISGSVENCLEIVESLLDRLSGDDKPEIVQAAKSNMQKSKDELVGFLRANEPENIDDWVSYADLTKVYGKKFVSLYAKPVQVGHMMRSRILKVTKSVTFMSATLTIGGSFNFIKRELGLHGENVAEFLGETPFDMDRQCQVYMADHLPDPSSPQYKGKLIEEITRLLKINGGRALVLFTNSSLMRSAHEEISKKVPYQCLLQGDGSKEQLISKFKNDETSCLFATRSFFSGVDIPGQTLNMVILTTAPFRVPTDPVFKAKCDRAGSQSFNTISMPLMLYDVQQAMGRLIRTTEDTGIFAFLDSRAVRSRYISNIRSVLPKNVVKL